MNTVGRVLRSLVPALCAVALLFSPALAETAAPSVRTVTIARGASYIIKGSDPGISPEVRAVDNPGALIVNRQPNGDVLVLGAEAGTETVKVTMADGTVQSYSVTVESLTNPANPLAPGSPPSGSVAAPSEAKSLDSGAGPVTNGRPEMLVAPESGANEAASASKAEAAGSSSATSAKSEPAAADAPLGIHEPSASNFSQISPLNAKLPTNPPAAGTDDGTVAANAPHYLPDDAITLMSGTSRLFDFPARIKRLSIADSEIADIQVISPHQLMLVGHKPGFTTLAVWDDQDHYEERQVRIEQTGHQQVLLSCVVAEVDRSRLENTGINYSGSLFNSGVSIVGLPGSVATPYSAQSQLSSSASNGSSQGGILPFGGQLIPLILSNNLTYGVATNNGQGFTQTFLQYLEAHDLGRVLAEPRLLANSGEEAKFLSGGEVPIVIAQALNTSVVFKQFGTSVTFIPTVVGRNEIHMVVRPEVSKPDPSQGVQLFGFTVPAFVTRRAETVVRLESGQTLIIAGLLSDDKQEVVNKVPYLGDVPFAGALFRTTSFKDVKTELVISVTPRIVAPIPPSARILYPMKGSLDAEDIRTRSLGYSDASRPRF
jgi:pilus assembly protein CpaC